MGEQGIDLELDGGAIKWELASGVSQLKVSNRTCSVDTLTAALRARYYFNSRYHNPGVPFTFVPYNYRASYVEAIVGAIRETVDCRYWIEDISHHYWFEHSVDFEDWRPGIGVSIINYFPKHFVTGGMSYSHMDGINKAYDVNVHVGAGWHGPNYRVGADVSLWEECIDSQRYGYPLHWSYDEWLQSIQTYMYGALEPFVEFTPRPYLKFAAAYRRTYDTDSDFWSVHIPISVSCTVIDWWLEFESQYVHYHEKFEDRTDGLDMTVRRYFGDHRIAGHVSYDYQTLHANDWHTYDVGVDVAVVLFHRGVIIEASYDFVFGDRPMGSDGEDITGHILGVNVTVY